MPSERGCAYCNFPFTRVRALSAAANITNSDALTEVLGRKYRQIAEMNKVEGGVDDCNCRLPLAK